LLAFLVIAFGAGLITDWMLEKTPLYGGLYDDPVRTIMHTGEERANDYNDGFGNWKDGYDYERQETYHLHGNRKLYGPHVAEMRFVDGHALAHKGEQYDESVIYPPVEWRL